jgi:hypothetical protein
MPKTSAKELATRKKRAALEAEHRQWVEARIAKLEKQGWSSEQISDELGLWIPPESSSAKQFLLDRLKGVDDANMYDEMHRGMVDLLRSDIPLDPQSRQRVADLFERLAFPDAKAKLHMKNRGFAFAVAEMKRLYRDQGKTAGEAENDIAEAFGLTVETLRQRMLRARK